MSSTHWQLLLRSVIALMLLFTFFPYQRNYAQKSPQIKRVTIHAQSVDIKSILDAITKQTGVYFMGTNDDVNINETISINEENQLLDGVVRKIFPPEFFKLTYDGNTILITKKVNENIKSRNSTNDKESSDTSIQIRGLIQNEKGKPIIGATVVVKGTSTGVLTNEYGRFEINAAVGKILTISFVGYISEELKVSKRNNQIKIALSEYVANLDETVIVAYGKTTKRLNVGNVFSIKSDEISRQPVNNPLYALQGRVPGLIVTPTSGLAGGVVDIQIRGRNSLLQTSEPLIVVDGLPISNTINGLGHNSLITMSQLNFINPNDIESMEILKDANATSIYGSRGANGVILITTKMGKPGDAKFDINIQNGISKVPHFLNLLSTQQYLQLRKDAYSNSNIDFVNTFPYGIPNYKYEPAPDLFVWDQNRQTDWQKKLIGGTAKYQDIQTSVSGGGDNVTYLIGGSMHRETTVFPEAKDDLKTSAHFNITGSSKNKKLKTTLLASYTHDNNKLPTIDLTYTAVTLAPNAPELYNEDGTLNYELSPLGQSTWENPYAALYRTYNAQTDNFIANVDLQYQIISGLNIKIQGGLNKLFGKSFRKIGPFEGRKPEQKNDPAASGFNRNEVSSTSFEPQLTYQTKVLGGDLNTLAGMSFQTSKLGQEQITAAGFTSDALLENWASAPYRFIMNSSSEYKYAAAFGRVSYNYSNRYLLNMTIRRDGSSRFGPKKRFGTFGSIGAGWIFSEEAFFRKAAKYISFGKVRMSYGSSGNDGIGDYQYLERYIPILSQLPYDGAIGIASQGLVNPYYAWEVTKKIETGIELGFIKDKIYLSGSYYRNRSSNQLSSYPYPSYVGPGYVYANIPATIQNSGIEIILNTNNIKKNKFQWSTSANITMTRNKLVDFPGLNGSAFYRSQIGKPFYGLQRVYEYYGVDPLNGKLQFKNAEGKIVDDPQDASRDDAGAFKEINILPKYYGGISNSITFKRVSVDFLFQFTKQIAMRSFTGLLAAGNSVNNMPIDVNSRWTKPGDKSEYPKLYGELSDPSYEKSINQLYQSDWAYVNASFIRLKNFSISYNLPIDILKKLSAKSFRFYVQGQNIFTITKYKGLDVETKSNYSLPPLRTITFGLQASF